MSPTASNMESQASLTLFVSTFFATTVERFNAATGASQGALIRGLNRTNGLALTPEGDLLVVETMGDNVGRYDRATGERKASLQGVNTPHKVAVGPDGNIYIPNAPSYPRPDKTTPVPGPDTIQRYDGRTSEPLGTFTTASTPFALAFGPDGHLYVSSVVEFGNTTPGSDYISRFDGRTGEPLGKFIQGLKHPYEILFDSDGNMLVPEYFKGHVLRFDGKTGAPMGTVALVPHPIGMAFGPDGDLYVGSFSVPTDPNDPSKDIPNSGSVHRFDARTGEPKGMVVAGLPFVSYVTFG